MKMSLRDARLQVMRGNLDQKYVKKDEVIEPEPAAPKPEPITPIVTAGPTNITVDTESMAQAVMQASQMQADVLARLLQPKELSKWTFRITERDRMGNIIAFTAEPAQ